MNEPSLKEVTIKEDVVFGESVTVIRPVNLYGCEIGTESFIGPYVEIQKLNNSQKVFGRQYDFELHNCSLKQSAFTLPPHFARILGMHLQHFPA